jgi:hypothetical protein
MSRGQASCMVLTTLGHQSCRHCSVNPAMGSSPTCPSAHWGVQASPAHTCPGYNTEGMRQCGALALIPACMPLAHAVPTLMEVTGGGL